ncbi:MAG: preprotein translocase subunit SecY [Fibrobacter sp.]|jgi:preprotein translocase subunit SecY|uniref:preprotein translocase subunit SecY n=1 Tax=unclassified Fibrobacter TaxID=2634177 RepID=UPI00090EF073|nr:MULTISPECIES: preprotein translocase subunit SecY [unclassified Fibrobacter]MBQ3720351.1 preprotein translocase subunit SecY [Fibrobacter sp.]MBQ9226636.1 preprotein translocase subunit SecY [Fibrobacter sp.]MBR2306171.1 preprotein translocase subunit SecY [Fibrobacter sp.]MBR3850998.1 preprotein translocase subunit SecY [Fibrobacter sp.]MBR4008728.1 preprotein translocase subunit SecY [Fibrobacter sp.]
MEALKKAIDAFVNAFKIADLRKKILFTLAVLIIYRVGAHITIPGVNAAVLAEYFKNSNNLFGLYDSFTGGAFAKATVFALGIMPYISASIIIQLMGSVIPGIQMLQKEGQEGRAKLNQYTRYFTVALAALQGWGISVWLSSLKVSVSGVQVSALADDFATGAGNIGFRLLATLTFTAGTIFVMYLGEQITSHGVGNGISLIIFAGIVGGLPRAFLAQWEMFKEDIQPLASEIIILAIVVVIIGFIVFVEQANRRIPLQSPRRTVGNKVMGGQSSYLPFKVNTAGVIPVIFASCIMFIPAMIASWFPNVSAMQSFAIAFVPGHLSYSVIDALLIIFFTFFYTAIQYNPNDIAENLKKSGGFIPGVRPGKQTAEYIDHVLTRISLPGSLYLAFISVAPWYLKDAFDMSFYIGGTSVLIVVGVALDTLRQLEAQLHTKNYEGFLKHGRIRGRMAS